MSAPLPRLMLVSPALDSDATVAGFAAGLAAVLERLPEAPVDALLLRGGGRDDAGFAEAIAPLIARAQGHGIAVLLEDRPDLLAASGADGLHVTLDDGTLADGAPDGDILGDALRGSDLLGNDTPSIKALRRRFGDEINLGAGCGGSRHLAMTAGEEGADYVAFGALDGPAANPELVAWWEAMMTPTQVALGAQDLDQARALAAAGPDFLAIGPSLLPAGEAAAGALAALLEALSAPGAEAPEGA